MMRSWQLKWLAGLALIVIVAGPSSAQERKWHEISSSQKVTAIDPESGSFLALDPVKGTASLYPPSWLDGEGKPITVEVNRGIKTAVYKRYKANRWFVIVSPVSSELFVLNATDLSLVKRWPLGDLDVEYVSTTRLEADPYIYGAINEKGLWRVNVDAWQVEFTSLGYGAGITKAEATVSGDGRTLCGYHGRRNLFRFRGQGDPLAAGQRWKFIRMGTARYSRLMAGPHGQWYGSGESVSKADGTKGGRGLRFPLRGFVAGGTVVLVSDSDILRAVSLQSMEPLGDGVVLPEGFLGVRPQVSSRGKKMPLNSEQSHVQVFDDPKHDRVLVVRDHRILPVALKDLGIGKESVVFARLEGSQKAFVGQPVKLSVRGVTPGTTVELTEKPDGMELVGERLVWTPTHPQVGPQSVGLRVSHGAVSQQQAFEMLVVMPSARIDVPVAHTRVSPSGKSAVAWGVEKPKGTRSQGSPKGQTHLAVVDLESLEVRATATMPYPAQLVAIGERWVYVAEEETSKLDVLSAVSLKKQRMVMLPDVAVKAEFLGPDLLSVMCRNGLVCYRTPGMTPTAILDIGDLARDLTSDVPQPAPTREGAPSRSDTNWRRFWDQRMRQRRAQQSRGTSSPPRGFTGQWLWSPEGWWINGCLLDPATGKAKALRSWPGLYGVRRQQPESRDPTFATTLPSWGRTYRSRKLSTTVYQQIAHLEGGGEQFLSDHPGMVTILPKSQQAQGGCEVVLWRLLDGVPATRRKLFSESSLDFKPLSLGADVAVCRDRIVGLNRNHVFTFRFDPATVKALPMPFFIERPMSIPVVTIPKSLTVKHTIRGASGPNRFALLTQPANGLDVDEATGNLTINGAALAEEAAQLAASLIVVKSADEEQADRKAAAAAVAKWAAAERKYLAKVADLDIEGIPILLPICLRALAADGQKATVRYQVVLDLPEQLVVDNLAAALRQRAEASRKDPSLN